MSGAEQQTRDRHATRRACLRTSRRKLALLISSREERAKARSSGTANSRPRCNRGACLRRGSLHQRRNEEERRALPLLRKVNQQLQIYFQLHKIVERNKLACGTKQGILLRYASRRSLGRTIHRKHAYAKLAYLAYEYSRF